MTISVRVALQPTGNEWAESKHRAGTNLHNSHVPPSFLLGGVCVDRGLWGPFPPRLQGLWGDCCHLLWTDFSPRQAAGQWGENMTALVCSDLIQSAYAQQSITFHLHITAPRCSKRLRTITVFVNLINFTLSVEYATASIICLRRWCRYHGNIVWIVVHAVIHVTRRHLTTYDVTHLCHLHKGIGPWESSHGWSHVEQTAGEQTCCFPAQAETFLSPCWTISGCSYTFLLSNQSSALPHATYGVVAIYLHELTRSWLRRAVLTHKAKGFYVWHTLWWGVRLYLCVTVSSEL